MYIRLPLKHFKSISLLILMGISLFPWKLICTTHPLGHEHHEHAGLSPCELRKQYKGEEPVYWPPMDCEHVSSSVDDYNQTTNEKITPTFQLLAVVAASLDLFKVDKPVNSYLISPDPKCRSATLRSDNPLRAPPLA